MLTNKINVLLVDDHELVRSGIEHILGQDPDIDVLAVASSGEEAIKLHRQLEPDVIMMDVNMPGMGGIEAIKRILNTHPTAKIIALSVYDDGPIPQHVISAGAKGYLNKGCPVEEMIKAVTTVFQGRNYLASEVATNMAFSPMGTNKNIFTHLSKRELQIASQIVNGIKIQDIAIALSISPKTVNTHRYRLHEKLKIDDDLALVRLAAEHGLLENL